jgi:hypothetical protein
MRITWQQLGMVSQNEFAKLAMMGSDGEVELSPPLTDDDGRDFEVHRKGRFGRGLSIQVKSNLKLRLIQGRRYIEHTIHMPVRRMHASALLWYFIAHLDTTRMEFANPCFLLPSAALYRFARRWKGHRIQYHFEASMSPTSRDRWSRYQVETRHIGRRLLQILSQIERREREVEMLLAMDQAAA